MAKYLQGHFKPKNPSKYRGDPQNIIYRSSWELSYMLRLDKNPNVIEWQSEEQYILYRSPLDGNIHRYFPDFKIVLKEPDGSLKTMIIEIKPASQTKPPVPKKKITKKLVREIAEYGINQAKWDAAKEYCAEEGYTFQVLTEIDLGIKR
jgi:wobble nucleotide-excising tRNase